MYYVNMKKVKELTGCTTPNLSDKFLRAHGTKKPGSLDKKFHNFESSR
jgi:hypothetical protein